MERKSKERIVILLLFTIFIFANISANFVFADEDNPKIDFNLTMTNSLFIGTQIKFNAISSEGNHVERKEEKKGILSIDKQSFSYGTEVEIQFIIEDLGGKALYDEEMKWNMTIEDRNGKSFILDSGDIWEDSITEGKVKSMLNLKSLYIKDSLQTDGKTFYIKFSIGERHKDIKSINIGCTTNFRGEIKPKAVIEENGEFKVLEDGIDFKFIGDGYVHSLEENRYFAKHYEAFGIQIDFPGECVFDRWKFTDYADSELSFPFGIKDENNLKNNFIGIIPNFNDSTLGYKKNDINLQAILKASPIVTFNPNVEGLESKDMQTNSGRIVLLGTTDFSRNGYVISSWHTGPDGTGDPITSGEKIEVDMIVYAQWIIDENAVFITPDLSYDDKTLPNIIAKEDGTIILPLEDPTRQDHKFLGWFDAKSAGNKVTNSTKFTKSTTIYAQWKETGYIKLSFLVDDVKHAEFKIDKDENLGKKIPEIKTPIDGYFFRGWFTEKDGKGTKLSSETNFSSENEERKDIYAYLLERESAGDKNGIIYVGFNYKHSNGSQTMSKPQNNITGELEWFVPTSPSEGLIFKGWYTAEKSGEKVEEGTIFLKETQLYAQWRKENIKVDFDLNGGDGSIPSVNADSDGKVTLPIEEPKRSGYEFIGWFDSNESGSPITENTIFDDDVTIYAQWEKVSEQELRILEARLERDSKIIARGKIGENDITLLVNLSDTEVNELGDGYYTLKIRSSDGTKVGQEGGYEGDWSGGIANGIGIDSPTKFTVYGNNDEIKEYILTIKRDIKEPELYIVTFNTNGGSTISSAKVKEGETVSAPVNPTKSGYKFAGWYRDVLFKYEFDFNTQINDDRELFAKWDEDVTELPKEGAPRITKFSLLGYEGSIDDRNGYITVYIPYNMELNGLVPNITLSEGSTISPRGDLAVNFNRSVYYTVYAKDGSKKEYRVSIDMPRENSSLENYWDDYYDSYKRKRDDYYKKRSEISWWEMSQEAKKEREKEALKDNRNELLVYKERSKIMNEVGKIESIFKNKRGSLYIHEVYNNIEIKPTVSNFAEGHSNMIIMPKSLLSSLPKGEYDYVTYSTGVVNIDIYPFMETVTGLRLNLKDVPKDIRKKWNKIKGKGFIFEVESDSTKGGLSYELNLEKKYPIEKIRFVKYDYTKGNFKDVSPEKWYIFDGKIRCEKVSAGIYGIIYKD